MEELSRANLGNGFCPVNIPEFLMHILLSPCLMLGTDSLSFSAHSMLGVFPCTEESQAFEFYEQDPNECT